MATTLIVRDATLAINGAPERRGEPREHLRGRIADVAAMDPRTAEECVEVLVPVAGGEHADPEVLEALAIIGLAHPALAERLGLAPVATGRRLAARLERAGEIEHTLALLEVLLQQHPGQEALERDLAAVMRRQGMVQDLVERYFERAKKLVREGRNQEAMGWLREVLALDGSRKDAARLIRDLRLRTRSRAQRRGVRWRSVLGVLACSLLGSLLVLREVRLRGEFRALPEAVEGNAGSLRRRLSDLDGFLAHHPAWHGVFALLAERSRLRVELAVLEDRARLEREAQEQARRERLEAADLCFRRGLPKIEDGDLAGALADFRQALELGGEDWELAEQVSRNAADIEAHLREAR